MGSVQKTESLQALQEERDLIKESGLTHMWESWWREALAATGRGSEKESINDISIKNWRGEGSWNFQKAQDAITPGHTDILRRMV